MKAAWGSPRLKLPVCHNSSDSRVSADVSSPPFAPSWMPVTADSHDSGDQADELAHIFSMHAATESDVALHAVGSVFWPVPTRLSEVFADSYPATVAQLPKIAQVRECQGCLVNHWSAHVTDTGIQ